VKKINGKRLLNYAGIIKINLRYVKEMTLWGCLAAISLYFRELNTAEIALAAIEYKNDNSKI
jgi:hypothetical protein